MCGDYDSILGMQKDEPVRRFIEKTPGGRLEPSLGAGALAGVALETDDSTGLAVKFAPVRIGPNVAEALPDFWG
jgi:calcineurin-like phosphoesterase